MNLTPNYLSSYDAVLQSWRPLGLIGRGTYGYVYRSGCLFNEQPLVIKEQYAKDAQEACTAANERTLLHGCCDWPLIPHTVRVVASIAEERIDGLCRYANLLEDGRRDLEKHYLSQEASPATLKDILCIFRQALEALEVFHLNWLHGDIAPPNMLWNPVTRHLKLCDFGLAANKEGTTQVVYRPLYRPPETWQRKNIRRTGTPGDIWALAMTICHLILKRRLPTSLGRDKNARLQAYRHTLQLDDLPPEEGTNSSPKKPQSVYEKIRQKLGYNDQKVEGLIDLLQKMFKFQPASRITAANALQHPLFTKLSDDIVLHIDYAQDLPPIQMHIRDRDDLQNNLTLHLPNLHSCFHLKNPQRNFEVQILDSQQKMYVCEPLLENHDTVTYTSSTPGPTIWAYPLQGVTGSSSQNTSSSSSKVVSPMLPLTPPPILPLRQNGKRKFQFGNR
ncbi:MAG: hypothetical protein A3D96_02400 [Chlamydiae bacterium RIFCSPHIGHO2_12_FULL_44_59]|nr:MAG: hypothetical protein A2796_05090 [Chlamydiae bacterium RIFCSPHIGHO2_01_FULL_44_39]OGN58533.1 MAG: hypothetical protein A3C42_03725 [Chlamydiae bacterium RIFCSPHIGHO2_02_FULL_45_9]OGN60750.1 MAG: hypothetical protein A3D96_02400 [Chlamydiae bacterium RIFCSPHIGHO2_12_FULL_44_59]OGN67010.1 MAG: hypothetical protein A2978_02630 [Chlamydiae bacterium RIFCSPLOWO2_01_FULL_44_52]OGN67563.1 MAG: hypothetical protein A3I67_03845 [Chlamydiae bacterium RIFCSPLOWO2_02_FULL_45_22]OGN71264.1 MAG: hyp